MEKKRSNKNRQNRVHDGHGETRMSGKDKPYEEVLRRGIDGKKKYFPHDFNARNDERIIKLRIWHGMLGYGIYFALLEWLATRYEMEGVTDYRLIAFDLHTEACIIESVINDFWLFTVSEDKKRFWSDDLYESMQIIHCPF
jgi:hypothetical protein